MYKFPAYWTEKLKVDFLQRVILIHSYLYYELNSSIWSDKKYDEIAKQLTELQKVNSYDWVRDKTKYGYVFYDFDGTTGFDLWERMNIRDKERISSIAYSILKRK